MNTLERAATRKWLEAKVVRELLHYDPVTGIFTWRGRAVETFPDARAAKVWNTRYAGKVAGSLAPSGYLRIRLLNKQWFAHRLAWLYMTGEWPKGEIDHCDRVKFNNNWANLRDASPSQNQYNKTLALSQSGFRGVCLHPRSGRWNARIKVAGRKMSLGYYDTPQEAAAAYDRAAKVHHGEFGVTNGA